MGWGRVFGSLFGIRNYSSIFSWNSSLLETRVFKKFEFLFIPNHKVSLYFSFRYTYEEILSTELISSTIWNKTIEIIWLNIIKVVCQHHLWISIDYLLMCLCPLFGTGMKKQKFHWTCTANNLKWTQLKWFKLNIMEYLL